MPHQKINNLCFNWYSSKRCCRTLNAGSWCRSDAFWDSLDNVLGPFTPSSILCLKFALPLSNPTSPIPNLSFSNPKPWFSPNSAAHHRSSLSPSLPFSVLHTTTQPYPASSTLVFITTPLPFAPFIIPLHPHETPLSCLHPRTQTSLTLPLHPHQSRLHSPSLLTAQPAIFVFPYLRTHLHQLHEFTANLHHLQSLHESKPPLPTQFANQHLCKPPPTQFQEQASFSIH